MERLGRLHLDLTGGPDRSDDKYFESYNAPVEQVGTGI